VEHVLFGAGQHVDLLIEGNGHLADGAGALRVHDVNVAGLLLNHSNGLGTE